MEQDELENDQTKISIECKNLQLGQNEIDLILSDGDPLQATVASVFEGAFGFRFSFFDEMEAETKAKTTAKYTFTLNVTETCTWDPSKWRNND